jgi:hypothetical protein
MDTRALTETGEVVVTDEAPAAPPFARWLLVGALATLPIHGLVAFIFWRMS